MLAGILQPFQPQLDRSRMIDLLKMQPGTSEELQTLIQQEDRWNRDLLITVFSVTTAAIHFYYGGTVFVLDGAGFLVFLAARYFLPQRESYQRYVRDGSMLYAALNIIPYFAKYGLYDGFENPIGMVAKLSELGLIYVQWREGQTAQTLSSLLTSAQGTSGPAAR